MNHQMKLFILFYFLSLYICFKFLFLKCILQYICRCIYRWAAFLGYHYACRHSVAHFLKCDVISFLVEGASLYHLAMAATPIHHGCSSAILKMIGTQSLLDVPTHDTLVSSATTDLEMFYCRCAYRGENTGECGRV